MKHEHQIQIGDKVRVNFHNGQFTLCRDATVLAIPCATGDSWVFRDDRERKIHYVSEGCTVSKLIPLPDPTGVLEGNELLVMIHRYLYYCKSSPILSDADYDKLEVVARLYAPADSPVNHPGSDLESSYSEDIRHQAEVMLADYKRKKGL